MKKPPTDYKRILNAVTHAYGLGIIQLSTNSNSFDGRILSLQGNDLIHFGNCSYLGLDTDDELKIGGIDAIIHFGNSFASSRQGVGLELNETLEQLLDQITGHHTLVTQTTTLGSLSAIPIITSPNDLIILDHQVHASVQNAVKIAQSQGTQVGMVRHSNMSALEEIIKKHQKDCGKIWYMSDGLYSMMGDSCPIDDMYQLMEIYSNFHCFVDDAHGMSWIGEHGKGYMLEKRPLHPKMVLIMSMNKAFGACGGILVFPTPEAQHLVKCLGSSLIYSGPIPTSVLGTCIASAKLHMTDKIKAKQNALYSRIKFFRKKACDYRLPLVNHNFSPIFYFAMGSEENAYYMVKKMLDAKFFINICNYPLVPKKNAGVRMSVTTHLTFNDIENALSKMAELINELEVQGKLPKEKVYQDFLATKAS